MARKSVLATDRAPKAIGPYSQGILHGELVFSAGQLGLNPASGDLVPGGVAAETRRALENLDAVLAAGGASLATVVKTTVFLRDLADFAVMNAVYAEFFPQDPPARSTVQVTALPKGAAVEIEAIAARSETIARQPARPA
jgi:2-iminobutanoate/2-iminopropanoate deaminase